MTMDCDLNFYAEHNHTTTTVLLQLIFWQNHDKTSLWQSGKQSSNEAADD